MYHDLILLIVCTDNMIYMDLCVQWKGMCQQSKFLQDKCPRTCGTCAPGKVSLYDSCILARHSFEASLIFWIILLCVFPEFWLIENVYNFFSELYLGWLGKLHSMYRELRRRIQDKKQGDCFPTLVWRSSLWRRCFWISCLQWATLPKYVLKSE